MTDTTAHTGTPAANKPFSKILLKMVISAEEADILARLGIRQDTATADEVRAKNEQYAALARANGYTPTVRKSAGHTLNDAGREKVFEGVMVNGLHDDFVGAGYVNTDVSLYHKQGGGGKKDGRWFLILAYLPGGEGVQEVQISTEARGAIVEDHLNHGYHKAYIYDNFRTDGSATVNATGRYDTRRSTPVQMDKDGNFYQV